MRIEIDTIPNLIFLWLAFAVGAVCAYDWLKTPRMETEINHNDFPKRLRPC
jgi:hypothetical protein